MKREIHLLVIGGGFAGIAAAVRARSGGARVTLLEARPTLGGRARSDVLDDIVIDTGAQLIASSFTHTRRLLERAGTALRVTAGRDLYVRDGARHPVQFGSIRSLLTFGGLGAVEKLKLAGTLLPLLARHRAHLGARGDELPPQLDAESATAYVARHIGAHVSDVLVEPPLNSFYAARGNETSLGFFLALGHYGSDSDVLAPIGGWTRLLEQSVAGIHRETNVRVESLNGIASGIVARAGEREWRADGAIVATSAIAARSLLATLGAYPDIDGWLASLDLRRTLTLALSVDASVGRDVFGIFTDPSAGRIVSACAVHGAKAGDDAIGTHDVILAWPTPEEATRLVAEPAERVVSAMLPEIERLLPAMRGRVRRARVYRVEEGTPLAAPGFAAQRKRGRQLLDELQAPVTLAGDYLTMPLVEGAVLSGEDAADRLLARIK